MRATPLVFLPVYDPDLFRMKADTVSRQERIAMRGRGNQQLIEGLGYR